MHLAETKGSGIRAMRELMVAHDLLPPNFESTRRPDQFVATFLFHHFLVESDLAWLREVTPERLSDEEARALVFVREVGAVDNASYRSINRVDTLSASSHLRRLRDLELLEMKGAGSRTYYVPGPRLLAVSTARTEADLRKAQPDVHQAGADLHHPPGGNPQISEGLRRRLPPPGTRPRQETLRALILDLCAETPRSAREIASLLGDRDPKNLVRLHLQPLLASGSLSFTIPEMPHHPDQKYATCPANETGARSGE